MNDTLRPQHFVYPKLREPIEVRLENYEEQQIILIRCPIGVSKEPLGLLPQAASLLQRFDGKTSVDTIQAELAEHGATHEIIMQLIQTLDDALFLDSPNFHSAHETLQRTFLDSRVRPPSLAGLSYAADAPKLVEQLTSYLAIGEKRQKSLQSKPLRALMTPHIDYQRGYHCYGMSFVALRDQQPDVTILIGTSHQYSEHLFHLTEKDFANPLGTLKNNQMFTKHLAAQYGEERSFADEMLHKQEHSLELQVPFIKHLAPNTEIVPILVGGLHTQVTSNALPNSHEPYQRFVEALAETIQQEIIQKNKTFMILAGVDMAHIGGYFGDTTPLSEEFMTQVRKRDEQYLRHVHKQDTEGLFTHIAEDHDARRICGFPTMYTVLDLFDLFGWKTTNKLLDYRQAVNWQTDCAVTFAGMAFYE